MPILLGATRECATGLVFTRARFSSRHGFHQSWNCKRVGLLEISEETLSVPMAIESKLFSSEFGIVRPARIFAILQLGSTAVNQFTVASKSICSIAAGNHMVTRRIQHSK